MKLASLGNKANKKETIDILKKTLVIRNKSCKELTAKCNVLGRGEARALRKLPFHRSCKELISENLGGGGRICQTNASSGCPMLRKYKLQKQFRSEIYQEGALDIEDLVILGSRIGTFPY